MSVLDTTLGALLIGLVASAILYGVTCIQTWYYYSGYPSDPWYIKFLVTGVFVLDTCHQALITHAAYTYLITDFGIPGALGEVVWSLIASAFFIGITAFFVQCFLAMRIYRLSNKRWLATGSVMTLVIGSFILSTVYTAKISYVQQFSKADNISTFSMVVDAVAAATNILIAVFLCYLLQISRTGFRKSNTIINKLIVFSINTGLITSVFSVAPLVAIAAWPGTAMYLPFYFCLGRLYCNSLLATLNARKMIVGESCSNEMSLTLQDVQQKTNPSMIGPPGMHAPSGIAIRIDTTQEYVRDENSALSDDVKRHEVV